MSALCAFRHLAMEHTCRRATFEVTWPDFSHTLWYYRGDPRYFVAISLSELALHIVQRSSRGSRNVRRFFAQKSLLHLGLTGCQMEMKDLEANSRWYDAAYRIHNATDGIL